MRRNRSGTKRASSVFAVAVGVMTLPAVLHADDPSRYGVDLDFGTGGFVQPPEIESDGGIVPDAAFDSQGRIVILGFVRSVPEGRQRNVLVRLMPDGRPDTSFGVGGHADVAPDPDLTWPGYTYTRPARVYTYVAVDPFDRIVIAKGTEMDSASRPVGEAAIRRYTPTGELDVSFGVGGKLRVSAPNQVDTSLRVTTDAAGNVLMALSQDMPGAPGLRTVQVARWTPSGEPDPSFGVGGIATLPAAYSNWPSTIAIDGEGRIVVAGTIAYSSQNRDRGLLLARFLDDGTPDPAFDTRPLDDSTFGTLSYATDSISFTPGGHVVADPETGVWEFGEDGARLGMITSHAVDCIATALPGDLGTLIWAPEGDGQGRFQRIDLDGLQSDVVGATHALRVPNAMGTRFHKLLAAPDGSVVAVAQSDFRGALLMRLRPAGTEASPDLATSADGIAVEARTVKGALVVTNRGSLPARGTVRLSLSFDDLPDASDERVRTIRFGRIQPGESKTIRLHLRMPRSVIDGRRRLLADVASNGAAPDAWRVNDSAVLVNFEQR